MQKIFPIMFLVLMFFSNFVQGKEMNLAIQQTKVGNIFVGQDPIAFKIESSAGEVGWRVKDFWGKVILNGKLGIKNGVGELVLPIKERGYFILNLTAGTVSRETSFGVLTPFDIKGANDSVFGMCTHFAQGYPPEVMDIVALAGIKTIRDELYWGMVEQKKGIYAFEPTYWYMDYARRAGVRPLICLSYGNILYDNNQAPFTKEGIQAYANYARAVVAKYGDMLEGVEVWNEYNCGFLTGKTGNKPEVYLQMLKTTYETVKAARPGMRVVGVAMSCLIWDWLDRLLNLGALAYMDTLSMHPYRWDRWNVPPESLDEDMVQLNAVIKKYNKTGRAIPAWSTEVSWPSIPKWEISPEKQADYIVRTYAVLWSRGVEKNYWYKLVCEVDDGMESQFGIMRHWTDPQGKLTPKPAYMALAVMTRQLTGWTFVEREKIDPAVWSLWFKKGNEERRLLWATRPAGVTVNADQPVTVTDMMGNDDTLQPVKGEFYLTLNGSPVYVKGPVKWIRAGAKISMITKQKIAVGDPIILKCTPDSGVSGVLEIEGTAYPIDGKAGMKVIHVPGEKTPGIRTLVYRVKTGGQVIAKGGLTVQVMDGLELKSAVVKKKDVIEFTFENHSVVRDVVLSSAAWEIAGRKGNFNSEVTIKPDSCRVIDLSIPELVPFQITPAKVKFHFRWLTPVLARGGKDSVSERSDRPVSRAVNRDISYSPCVKGAGKSLYVDLGKKGTIKMEGYKGKADLTGGFQIGWDDENFYLTARIDDDRFCQNYPREELWSGDGIQFGLASDSDFRYEFCVALTGQGVRADCEFSPVAINKDNLVSRSKWTVKREGKSLIYQVTIPWTLIPPIKPQNGSFLFSFLVNDNDSTGRKGWIEWAGGIGDSKSVEFYQPCLFVDN